MWVALMRKIWDHINKVTFRNAIFDEDEISCLTQMKGWIWITYLNKIATFSYQVGACVKNMLTNVITSIHLYINLVQRLTISIWTSNKFSNQ